MRKIILTIAFLAFIAANSNSQPWWLSQNSGAGFNLNSTYFIDANTGYVVGDSGSTILKTTNSGLNWFRQSTLPLNQAPLKSIYFLNANSGFAVGSNAPIQVVYKTVNGGTNWIQIYSQNSIYGMLSVYFINSLTGIATGSASSSGYIFRTTNGGLNWANQDSAGTVLHSVYFTDNNTGYACGQSGIIIKTTNSGVNWFQQTSNTSTSLRSIYFINSLTGWSAGTDSRLYKTTNGGNNWSLFYNQSLCGLYFVYFANEQTGWTCGCEGAISGTKNGGVNWSIQTIATTSFLYSMSFVSPLTGWAVGAFGKVLKTTNGGISFIHIISSEIPEVFSLEQNYPNPFNPVTKIKFDVPDFPLNKGGQGVVSLIVYDALGKEVTTLVNEKLSPGSYEVEFSATGRGNNLSSGVYFYKLETENSSTGSGQSVVGGFSEVKRMILLK